MAKQAFGKKQLRNIDGENPPDSRNRRGSRSPASCSKRNHLWPGFLRRARGGLRGTGAGPGPPQPRQSPGRPPGGSAPPGSLPRSPSRGGRGHSRRELPGPEEAPGPQLLQLHGPRQVAFDLRQEAAGLGLQALAVGQQLVVDDLLLRLRRRHGRGRCPGSATAPAPPARARRTGNGPERALLALPRPATFRRGGGRRRLREAAPGPAAPEGRRPRAAPRRHLHRAGPGAAPASLLSCLCG